MCLLCVCVCWKSTYFPIKHNPNDLNLEAMYVHLCIHIIYPQHMYLLLPLTKATTSSPPECVRITVNDLMEFSYLFSSSHLDSLIVCAHSKWIIIELDSTIYWMSIKNVANIYTENGVLRRNMSEQLKKFVHYLAQSRLRTKNFYFLFQTNIRFATKSHWRKNCRAIHSWIESFRTWLPSMIRRCKQFQMQTQSKIGEIRFH